MSFGFEMTVCSGRRTRTSTIRTPHGDIRTPAFMPVGTKTNVKAVPPEVMTDLDTQALLTSAYHLYLQPGSDLVDKAGGLGCFMSWPGPTPTDSGGFQVMSLDAGLKEVLVTDIKGFVGDDVIAEGKTRRVHVDEDGVTFLSHLSGSHFRFTPEVSMTIQHQFGVDIIFAFSELTTLMNTRDYQEVSVARTHRWAVRCLRAHVTLTEKHVEGPHQTLFGVIRGAQYEDLRRRTTTDLAILEVGGFRFGGSGLGGALEKENPGRIIGWMVDGPPKDWPRHLFGTSEPEDLFEAVALGADTFDCANPSRVVRNVVIYAADRRHNVSTVGNRRAFELLEMGCDCYTRTHYTRTCLHHLLKAREMLVSALAIIHNGRFMVRLVDEIRTSLESDEFDLFRNRFMGRYSAQKT